MLQERTGNEAEKVSKVQKKKKKHRGNKDQEERTNKLHSCDLQLAHARPTLPCIHLVVEFATATHLTVSLITPLSLSLCCAQN